MFFIKKLKNTDKQIQKEKIKLTPEPIIYG
jgi:hypothetical protein